MNWGSCEKKENLYKIPGNWLGIHYYEALTILFRLENSLRVFVYSVLKDQYLDKWDKQTIIINGEARTLHQIFSYRKNQSDDFGYIGAPSNSPLMYLSLGELASIITGSSWNYFKEFFPAKKEIIKNKFDEINTIRNALAHFRPISLGDVSLIKIYAEQVLKHVAKYLENLMSGWQHFPTNSKNSWYLDLHDQSSKYIKTILSQSNDEKWIKLDIHFRAGEISTLEQKSAMNFFMSLDALHIVEDVNLKKNLIYITEKNPERIYSYDNAKTILQVTKTISLIMSKKNLNQSYDSYIKNTIATLINHISLEAEMVNTDKLHRGKFISGSNLYYYKKDSSWSTSSNFFNSSVAILHEPEHWGEIPFLFHDYISGTPRYPWMSSVISEEEFMF